MSVEQQDISSPIWNSVSFQGFKGAQNISQSPATSVTKQHGLALCLGELFRSVELRSTSLGQCIFCAATVNARS